MAANTPQQHVQAVKKAEDEAKQQNQTGGKVEDARKQQQEQKTIECTIIVSGLNYSQNGNLLQDAANAADKILLLFDAVPSYSYSRTVQKTDFAVESQQTYSDHAVIKDDVFTLTAFINTSPTIIRKGNKIDESTDPDNPAASLRPAKALDLLKLLVDNRQLITLATEEGTYQEFIITKLTAKRDVSEGAALVVDLELTQFRTFTIGKVVNADVTSDPKKSPTKNKGAVQSSTKGDDKFKKEPSALAPDKEKPTADKTPGVGDLDKHKSHVISRQNLPNSTKEVVKGDNKQSDIPN
ncbi:phage baseplate protein [Escherichia coli O169]